MPPAPFAGVQTVEPALRDLVPYIDWSPFFHAWELRGTYPAILDKPEVGERAKELLDDGRALLERICDEGLLRARGVYGFFPAAADGDDIIVFSDERTAAQRLRLSMLRQQEDRNITYCLADFIAPRTTGLRDHIGGFAVTAGLGARELAERYERDHDDYNAILVKALADRLVEAFAEMLHQRVRTAWYDEGESLGIDELLSEGYRGIRPAYGYPACPDHSEKRSLMALLDAEKTTGITLTEGFAMFPAASVSGLYFAHADSRYFAVGRLARDQIEDYARRKGVSIEQAERFLAANLGY